MPQPEFQSDNQFDYDLGDFLPSWLGLSEVDDPAGWQLERGPEPVVDPLDDLEVVGGNIDEDQYPDPEFNYAPTPFDPSGNTEEE